MTAADDEPACGSGGKPGPRHPALQRCAELRAALRGLRAGSKRPAGRRGPAGEQRTRAPPWAAWGPGPSLDEVLFAAFRAARRARRRAPAERRTLIAMKSTSLCLLGWNANVLPWHHCGSCTHRHGDRLHLNSVSHMEPRDNARLCRAAAPRPHWSACVALPVREVLLARSAGCPPSRPTDGAVQIARLASRRSR